MWSVPCSQGASLATKMSVLPDPPARQFLRQLVVKSPQPVPVAPKHSWHAGVIAVPSSLQALSPQTEAQAPKQAHLRSAPYALVAAEPSQSFAAPPELTTPAQVVVESQASAGQLPEG